MRIIDRNRAFQNLYFFLRLSFLSVMILAVLLVRFCRLFLNMLDHCIRIKQIFLVDRLIFRLCVSLGEINLNRHKGAVALQHFPCTILIRKLQAVFI